MVERIPMSKDGYDKLRAQLDQMEGPEMQEITKRIATARALGDLSENAEYHAAREDQGHLQARIDQIRDKLNRAEIIDLDNLPEDTVVFNTRVKVKDLDLDDEEYFEIVGPGDEKADENRVLTASPIGQGLLGKKVGDIAEIKAPMGIIRFKILDIAFRNTDGAE